MVIKAHRTPVDLGAAQATVDAQQVLAAAGFPCPVPLAGPDDVDGRVLTAETLIDGARPDGRDPATRRLLARGSLGTSTSSATGRTWSVGLAADLRGATTSRAPGLFPTTRSSTSRRLRRLRVARRVRTTSRRPDPDSPGSRPGRRWSRRLVRRQHRGLTDLLAGPSTGSSSPTPRRSSRVSPPRATPPAPPLVAGCRLPTRSPPLCTTMRGTGPAIDAGRRDSRRSGRLDPRVQCSLAGRADRSRHERHRHHRPGADSPRRLPVTDLVLTAHSRRRT